MRFFNLVIIGLLALAILGAGSCNKGSGSSGSTGTTSTSSPTDDGGGHGKVVKDTNGTRDADGDGFTEIVGDASDWPAEIPRYPGSQVVHQDAPEGGEMWGAVLSTEDGRDQVLQFYRDGMEANGFTYRDRHEIEGATVDFYGRGDMSVNIGFEENENGRAITILALGFDIKAMQEADEGEAGTGEDGSAEAGGGDAGDTSDGGSTTRAYTLNDTLSGYAKRALPAYPDADVTQTITEGAQSGMVMASQDDTEQIIAFYEEHWKSLKLQRTDNVDMGGMRMVAWQNKEGKASCTVMDGGSSKIITLAFDAEDGAEVSGEADADGGSSFQMSTGNLPEGWPAEVLPQYPGSKIQSAAINEGEYTLLQTSADADNEVVKFYDKHFREAGWKKTDSQTVMGTYIGGWEKADFAIDMTCRKEDSGGSFVSLVYYPR